MKISVPYDKNDAMSVELDDRLQVNFLEANDVDIDPDKNIIQEAVDAPINQKAFK
ncbi:MAG: general glycosylation pathway protein, partial [Desulfobacteraceae bacterium]